MNVKYIVTASLIGILLIPRAGLAQRLPSSGTLHESIRREAVRLASAAAQTAPQQQRQHRSWAARHPIALGAILGIVTAGAIAQLSDGRATDSDGHLVFLNGAVPGLLIGSSIGAVVAFTQD